jgi:hypothetical protein
MATELKYQFIPVYTPELQEINVIVETYSR